MEAGECGLTRGMCFAERRLELVAVAAVNFVVCFRWDEFFFRALHEFAFPNSFVDPV